MSDHIPQLHADELTWGHLRENDLRFRQLVENIDDVVWIHDVHAGRSVYVSPACMRVLGLPEAAIQADPDAWHRRVHPEDRARVADAVAKQRASGFQMNFQIDYRIVKPDGEVRWLRGRGFPIRDGRGRIYRAAGIAEDITESRRAAEELAAAESHYRRLVMTTPETIVALDAEGRFTELNPAGEALFGRRAADLIGRPFTDVQDAKCRPRARALFARLIGGTKAVDAIETRILRPDGALRTVAMRIAVIRDGDAVIGTHAVLHDVTAERSARRDLEETAARLTQILATSPTILAALRLDSDGTAVATWVSENLYEILGYEPEAVIGDASWWAQGVHPDDRERAFAAFGRTRTNDANMHEYRFRDAHGAWRWMHDRQRVISDEDGVREVLVSWTDLTESRKSREALEESELTHRTLFNSLMEMVYIMDLEGRLLDVNEAVVTRTGYARNELIGRVPRFLAALDKGEETRLQDHFERAIAGMPQRGVRLTGCTRDGGTFAAELSFVRARYFGKDAIIAVSQDITERRIAEDRIAAAESHYRRLVENSPYCIYELDTEGRFTEINTAGLQLFARPYDEVIGIRLASLVAPADIGTVSEALRRRLEGIDVTTELELCIVRPGGERRLLQLRATSILEDGAVVGMHGIARDITNERKNAEQLRRAERLATVGTLIGGVAHELNNPLQAIINFASLLIEDAHTAEEGKDLETIRREASRAGRIVADLRLLARNTQEVLGNRTYVDLNDIVCHVLRTRRYSLASRNIDVVEELTEELPLVWADAADMEQVLINLMVNAEQAMAEARPERRLTLRTSVTGKDVAVHVIDTGTGIARAHLDQIFDPFFTTKSRSEGTGLGLALVHKIVMEHEGQIHADSEIGRGTAFHIHLPAATRAERPNADATAAVAPPPAAERLRILLIDDEPAIRAAVSRYLKRRGHVVDTAGEGAEALRLVDAFGAAYHVIVSDLRMPGISGEELLQQFRERGCMLGARLMFLTGDAASGDAARIVAEASVPVILKPIELHELARRIEQHARDAGPLGKCAAHA